MVRPLVACGFMMQLLAGCGPRDVVIAVSIPNESGIETPLPGVRLVLLPYDRDSLLKTLENRAPTTRPSQARLDSLFARFRGPFNDYLQAASALDQTRRARESATDSLTRKRLDDSLKVLSGRLEQFRTNLSAVRSRLEPAIDSERSRLRGWEDTAFRSYDSLGARLVRELHREPIVDSTRSNGMTRIRIRSGNWWAVARAVNVKDPNAEWYWNVKIVGDTVRLGPTNGRSKARI